VIATPSIERYNAVMRRLDAIGQRPGISVEVLDVLRRSGQPLPFFAVHAGSSDASQVCICAGIHGDEPAGVEAALRFLERYDESADHVGLLVFPCTNPSGFVAATRRNDVGYDLNRTFGQDPAPRETELVRQVLAGRRFECGMDLHEDVDARGFYLYEHVRGGLAPLAPAIVSRVRDLGMPIQDTDAVEGRKLENGSVAPAEERISETIGFLSIYLFDGLTDRTLNPETPSSLPMPARVAMHLTAVSEALAAASRGSRQAAAR
jgi:hypothetical protein